ncbi:Bug family tripartite tricarboxylate transporter substrate binding protein [Achromobacter deleyi]|uniref:Bug family tripartite tricarboxylate transporter substrate binding protein n=1 Tax=Achromobacter deleyi TaxID=1353891 RepID=UPI0014926C48|nr:tripartite tricarboxylate transporter substrate binding protein [Achromobacter deleyi]QVQ26980.1 tripartite tricarboxylate transporter substrate binding protein [Achromobacter deleyi]UIP22558.1 tripartite tricarboxylate transporter substrate binding protein [Achromobacter deleyi]
MSDKQLHRIPLGRNLAAIIICGSSALLASGVAAAADWPDGKPITIVVPFSPGGFTDLVARRYAQDLGNALKTTIVVQNKPGASGQIGTALVTREKPDGYNLLVTATQHVIYPGLQPNLPYDPKKSFSNVAILAYAPNVLLVPAKSPISNAKEFTAYANKQPGGLAFGSSSVGGSAHMSGELYKMVAGANLRHIPYKGAAPAVTDLIGAQIPAAFLDATSAAAFIRSGDVKALAVTSKDRLPSLPDVPTVAESGYPSYESQAWIGLFGPAGMPTPIVQRLNQIAIDSANTEANIKWLNDNNATPAKLSPAQVSGFVDAELDKWKTVIDKAHVTVQ